MKLNKRIHSFKLNHFVGNKFKIHIYDGFKLLYIECIHNEYYLHCEVDINKPIVTKKIAIFNTNEELDLEYYYKHLISIKADNSTIKHFYECIL